jgi:hypothetical protein
MCENAHVIGRLGVFPARCVRCGVTYVGCAVNVELYMIVCFWREGKRMKEVVARR